MMIINEIMNVNVAALYLSKITKLMKALTILDTIKLTKNPPNEYPIKSIIKSII